MDVPLDEVIHFDAIASSSTGAAVDADSTPTFAVYEESTDTDIGVGGNLTKRTSLTGNYRGSFTASAANGFELGKWYHVIGSATIGGVATKGVLMRFRVVAAEITAGYPLADLAKWLGTAPLALSSQQVQAIVPDTQKVDVNTLKTQSITCAAGVTVGAFVGQGTAAIGVNASGHVSRVVLVDTLTTYTGNTPQTGDAYARIGNNGAGLTNIVLPSGGLANVTAWTVAITGNITGNLSGSVGSVTGGVTVQTNNDKTGYALTTGERTSIANEVEAQIIDETDSEKVLTAITDKIASVNPDLSGLTLSAIASSVWNSGTRILTAGTNIVLAKGTGVTGFNDLSAAQVNTEVDTALADYDGPTHAELTSELATADDAVLAAIAALNNLSAAQVNSEVDTALADYDGPTHAELTAELAAADDAVLAAIASLSIPTAAQNAAALLDLANGIESNLTPRQMGRLLASVLLSNSTNGGKSFRDYNDTKDRITSTVDASSNRTVVTRDAS